MLKLYYSISEISDMVGEEQHILRYWEKEFDELKPKKNRGGNRIYSEKDLFIIKTIKQLIRSDKLSLIGAREQLTRILFNFTDDTLFGVGDKSLPKQESIMPINDVPMKLNEDEIIINRKDLLIIQNELKQILEELEA